MNPSKYFTTDQISEVLPLKFDFYHLGHVELLEHDIESKVLSECETQGIGFQLKGDINASLIIILEQSLDSSIYSEVGNVIASKIANQLYHQKQLMISISPPYLLNPTKLNLILRNASSVIRRTYLHQYLENFVTIETVFLSSALEEMGHA